jgi:putative Holliday junction resolvase
MPSRVLAIDFGTKRIGLAVSDPLALTAQGLETLERTQLGRDLDRICLLIEEYEVGRVVLGNPISARGEETEMSRRVASFAEKLRRRITCPVLLWDERLTSAQAGRVLREAGLGIEKRRRARDRVAAVLLLSSYLDYLAGQSLHPPDGESAP